MRVGGRCSCGNVSSPYSNSDNSDEAKVVSGI